MPEPSRSWSFAKPGQPSNARQMIVTREDAARVVRQANAGEPVENWEAAMLTGCSLEAANETHRRALRKLRNLLGDEDNFF